MKKKAKEVSEKRLDQVLGSGYGIFSGDNVTRATLRFTPEQARWVAAEKWHPDQVGRGLDDGGYELKVSYTDDRELLMDALKFEADCQVVERTTLREWVLTECSKVRGTERAGAPSLLYCGLDH